MPPHLAWYFIPQSKDSRGQWQGTVTVSPLFNTGSADLRTLGWKLWLSHFISVTPMLLVGETVWVFLAARSSSDAPGHCCFTAQAGSASYTGEVGAMGSRDSSSALMASV